MGRCGIRSPPTRIRILVGARTRVVGTTASGVGLEAAEIGRTRGLQVERVASAHASKPSTPRMGWLSHVDAQTAYFAASIRREAGCGERRAARSSVFYPPTDPTGRHTRTKAGRLARS